jgi:hypothetical protein
MTTNSPAMSMFQFLERLLEVLLIEPHFNIFNDAGKAGSHSHISSGAAGVTTTVSDLFCSATLRTSSVRAA